MLKKFLSIVFVLVLILGVLSGWAIAQDEFPTKPIDIIVGQNPGGTIDAAARFLATTASPFLNDVNINVVNMPGGQQMIAFNYVLTQDPEGYTLIVGYGSENARTIMGLDVPMNVDPDPEVGAFRPVIASFAHTAALAVPYDSPFESLDELVEYAKENPGELDFGHVGTYSSQWIMVKSFLKAADIDVVEVPFAGGANTRQEIAAETVDCGVIATFLAPDFVKDKMLRVLAVFAPERDPVAKDVPTFRELGYEVFDLLLYKIIGASAETPDWKIERLYEGFRQAKQTAEFRQLVEDRGFISVEWSPEKCQEKAEEYDSRIKELVEKGIIPKQK